MTFLVFLTPQAHLTPLRVVDRIFARVLGPRFGGCGARRQNASMIPVFWPEALPQFRSYEYEFTRGAVSRCASIRLVPSAVEAELVLLELWSLSLVDVKGHVLSKRRPLRGLVAAIHAEVGARQVPLVGIDWADSPARTLDDNRITHYFKRSMAKCIAGSCDLGKVSVDYVAQMRRPLAETGANRSRTLPLPLQYPVKKSLTILITRALRRARPRAERPVDVSCFFVAKQPITPCVDDDLEGDD